MAYIPTRPITAEDPLAYFAVQAARLLRPTCPALPMQPVSALDQMFGYYNAE